MQWIVTISLVKVNFTKNNIRTFLGLSTPTILAHGLQSNDIIQEGSNVTLNCYTVDDKINLTWVDNFGYIVSNSPILKFENITKHNAGIYRCKSQKEVAFMYSPIFRINISCKYFDLYY